MATDGGATTDAGAAKDGDADAGFVCGPRAGDTVLATTDSSRTFKNRAGAVTPHSLYLPPGYGSAGNTQRQRSPVVCHLPGKGLNSTHAGAQVQNVSANCEDARCTPSLHIAPVIIIFPDGHAAEDDVHDLMAFVMRRTERNPTEYPQRFCAWVGDDGPLNTWEAVNQAHRGHSESSFNTANRNGVRFRQVVTSMVHPNAEFRAPRSSTQASRT